MPENEEIPKSVLEERPEQSLTQVDPKLIAGRYTIVNHLGDGGMGKVYHAFDSVFQQLTEAMNHAHSKGIIHPSI